MKKFTLPALLCAALLPGAALALPPVDQATGSGHITLNGENRTFSFTAKTDIDGTSSGEAQLQARQADNRLHMNIDCLVVSGNQATMSGTVTQSTDPAFENSDFLFAVEDNGEGKKAPPDRLSLVFLFGTGSGVNCQNTAIAPDTDIERGNIQVH